MAPRPPSVTFKWKASKDPLSRGDSSGGVQRPDPTADPSIVRHILYLEGAGRTTPYLSTTENVSVAEHFAGTSGSVWETWVARAREAGVRHIDRRELLDSLKGSGKGEARWRSAFEVAQARVYVEQWLEHLMDFRAFAGRASDADLQTTVNRLFTRARRR